MLLGPVPALAAETHSASGLVLSVDRVHRSLVVSCDAVPGYMDAMEMPFAVHDAGALAGVKPGLTVRFTIVQRGRTLYATAIHPGTVANFESEPMEAAGLTALKGALSPTATAEIAVGQQAPDFALTDQAGKQIHLTQFRGKVVALTFGYSRCPNPNYCFRLSSNLAWVAEHHGRAGRNLALLTIVIDPEHDRGAALAEYANTWHADPAVWHFLTGPLPEIRQVAATYGMNFWSTGGTLTHTLHTVILDRGGRLAANLNGNQFTAKQLGDLVQTVIDRPNSDRPN
jgi:protein SCO1/2